MATRKKASAVKSASKKAKPGGRPKAAGETKPAKKAVKRTPASGARGAFRKRQQPESLRLKTITPGMTVDDLTRSIEFYTRALGFVVGERWTSDEGVLRGVMLRAGSCSIGLSQDDWSKGRDRKKGVGIRIWCETAQNLDALAARIRVAGGPQPVGPKLESWGSRTLAVVDPDGYQLSFTEITATGA